MTNLVRAVGGAVQKHDPKKAALTIHSMEAAEKIAARAKDPTALRAAIVQKLEAQRDFAVAYKSEVKRGSPYLSKDARTGAIEFCESYGFPLRVVQRWCERLLEEDSFQAELRERLAKVLRLVEMEQAANFSSESVEWYTPPEYVEAAREVMGGIDLDPASSEKANETVKATQYLTDGLEVEWHGRVFLNPPYGRTESGDSLAACFCMKAIESYRLGLVEAAVVLVNSVHSQKWQAPLYDFPTCFVNHRIEFISGDGTRNENPTFQNIFVYLGMEVPRFVDSFSPFGYVMARLL